MKIKKPIRLIAKFVLFTLIGFNQNAWSLDQIIRPFQGIRTSGMGGTCVTTGLYEDNFFCNPSRILENPKDRFTLLNLMSEVGTNAISHVKNLTGSGDFYEKMTSTIGENNHLRVQTSFPALYIPPGQGRWAFAFGVLMSSQVDVDLRSSFQITPTAYTDIGPAISFARSFLDDESLGIGVTAHATYRLATNQAFTFVDLIKGRSISASNLAGQGAHFDFDVGAIYDLPFELSWIDFTLGLTATHVLGGKYENLKLKPIKSIDAQAPAQPRSYGIGISATLADFIGFTDTILAAEVRDIGNNPQGSFYKTVHLGAETQFGILAPRIGLNQGYLSAGLGIDLRILTLDFATYSEEMSLNAGGLEDRRYAAKIALQF